VSRRPAELAGVGAVRMVRTFRVSADGGLYAVNTPARWQPGWNVARCGRGKTHAAPDARCRCGLYVYAHPAFTRQQPNASQVLAVVEVQGAMEVGTRGARVAQARIEALWLGPRVRGDLAAAVSHRYPSVTIYRDKLAMLACFPLTALSCFRPPRFAQRAHVAARLGLALLILAAVLAGAMPTSPLTEQGSALWSVLVLSGLAVAVGAVTCRAPLLALGGLSEVAWLVTEMSPTSTAICYRALVVLVAIWVAGAWLRTARIGANLSETRRRGGLRRWWSNLPGARLSMRSAPTVAAASI
jgi:hypothetical protein